MTRKLAVVLFVVALVCAAGAIVLATKVGYADNGVPMAWSVDVAWLYVFGAIYLAVYDSYAHGASLRFFKVNMRQIRSLCRHLDKWKVEEIRKSVQLAINKEIAGEAVRMETAFREEGEAMEAMRKGHPTTEILKKVRDCTEKVRCAKEGFQRLCRSARYFGFAVESDYKNYLTGTREPVSARRT